MTTDGTDNKQDNPSADDKGTSEKEPETLTEEDRTKKAVSDALSAAGRDAKAMEIRESAVKEALTKAEKLQTDIKKTADEKVETDYRAALDRAGDDPLAKSKVELDHSLKTVRAKLADTQSDLGKRNEELTDARKVAAESTKERNAREIASKYAVSLELLALTDGSVESMEALAKQISGKEIKTLKPDESKTTGIVTIPESAKGKMKAGWDELHK